MTTTKYWPEAPTFHGWVHWDPHMPLVKGCVLVQYRGIFPDLKPKNHPDRGQWLDDYHGVLPNDQWPSALDPMYGNWAIYYRQHRKPASRYAEPLPLP